MDKEVITRALLPPPNAQVHRAGAAALDETVDLRCAGSGATASSAAPLAETALAPAHLVIALLLDRRSTRACARYGSSVSIMSLGS